MKPKTREHVWPIHVWKWFRMLTELLSQFEYDQSWHRLLIIIIFCHGCLRSNKQHNASVRVQIIIAKHTPWNKFIKSLQLWFNPKVLSIYLNPDVALFFDQAVRFIFLNVLPSSKRRELIKFILYQTLFLS